MRFIVAALALSLLVAGCVSSPDTTETAATAPATSDAAVWDAIRATVGDAPCEADVGAQTSANLVTLGKFQADEGEIGEIDIRGDMALLARHNLGGLVVLDLTDPREPTAVSTLLMEGASAFDVKWLPDGSGALIGAGENKIYVIDLTDLANPVLASEVDFPTQAHMVQPAVIDNVTYVYVASQTEPLPAYVYRLNGFELELVGTFGLGLGPIQSGPLGNHDIAVIWDEILQAPILYLADGVAGWSAWSLDDPAAPARIGGSIGQELGVGYVHTVRVGFYDGKRIVATMQEVGQNTLKIYDATDLGMPILLARWNADPTRPTIPQHNIQILGDWLFMGHYTEGFYVFNLSGVVAGPPLLGTLELRPAAHFAVEDPAEGGALGFANVWDVSVRRGVVYASDLTGSVTAVAFSCLALGDEAASATL